MNEEEDDITEPEEVDDEEEGQDDSDLEAGGSSAPPAPPPPRTLASSGRGGASVVAAPEAAAAASSTASPAAAPTSETRQALQKYFLNRMKPDGSGKLPSALALKQFDLQHPPSENESKANEIMIQELTARAGQRDRLGNFLNGLALAADPNYRYTMEAINKGRERQDALRMQLAHAKMRQSELAGQTDLSKQKAGLVYKDEDLKGEDAAANSLARMEGKPAAAKTLDPQKQWEFEQEQKLGYKVPTGPPKVPKPVDEDLKTSRHNNAELSTIKLKAAQNPQGKTPTAKQQLSELRRQQAEDARAISGLHPNWEHDENGGIRKYYDPKKGKSPDAVNPAQEAVETHWFGPDTRAPLSDDEKKINAALPEAQKIAQRMLARKQQINQISQGILNGQATKTEGTAPEKKNVNGKTYEKVQGGWQLAPGQ